jgi:hypothetical protein
METYQLMSMDVINADGSMADIAFYRELRARSPFELPDMLESIFCEIMDVNTDVLFNGTMAPGHSTPEVRVYVGKVAGTEGNRDDGQVVIVTLMKVSR